MPTRPVPWTAARVAEAVASPCRSRSGRPYQRTRPRTHRTMDCPVRRQDLGRMAICESPRTARGRSRGLRRHPPVDRSRGLDRLAAHRDRVAKRLHRGLQGHLPGRPLPQLRFSGRAEPRVRRLPRNSAGPHAGPTRRRSGPAHRPGRSLDGPARRDSRSLSATSTPTSLPPRRGRSPPVSCSRHGDLDLPRAQRRPAHRSAGHLRGGGRRDHRGKIRLRSGAERRR